MMELTNVLIILSNLLDEDFDMSNSIMIENNEFFQLLYHPDIKTVHHIALQRLVGATLRNLLTRGTEIFREYGATKWLSDDRKMGAGVTPEDAQWGIDNWSNPTIAAGWKYWAILVPDAIEGRARMSKFMEDYFEKGVRINLFTSTEDALKWLASLP